MLWYHRQLRLSLSMYRQSITDQAQQLGAKTERERDYIAALALFYADHDIKLDEALTLAHKEFEVRHDIYTWDALAWALYKNGKYQEASDAMDHALRPGARDALLLFHAGMIASRLGQTSQAKERLQSALSINPHFHVIYSEVAQQQLKTLDAQAGLTASQGRTHVP